MILAAGQQADVVHTEIRDVADEQAVVEGGAAAVQEVERRAGDLRAVVAEDAVAEHRGVERPAEVLDGYTGAAWAGVIADHLDALDGRIGARIDLDAAAIEIEERRLGHVIGFDWRALAGAGGVVLRAGDAETAQHGLRRYAVAEIDDVIDDRREAWRLVIGDRWIGGGQHHLADRFERDAVVPLVEPDQRLPVRRRAIGPGVDVDDLVGRILRGRLERRLDAAAGLDAVGTRRRVERHGISCVAALGETAHRLHGGRGRHPEERTSAHDQLRLSRGRGGSLPGGMRALYYGDWDVEPLVMGSLAGSPRRRDHVRPRNGSAQASK